MKLPTISNLISLIRAQNMIFEVKLLISFLLIIVYNPLVLLPLNLPSSVWIDVIAAAILVIIVHYLPLPSTNVINIPEYKGDLIEIDPEDARDVSSIVISSTSILGLKSRK